MSIPFVTGPDGRARDGAVGLDAGEAPDRRSIPLQMIWEGLRIAEMLE